MKKKKIIKAITAVLWMLLTVLCVYLFLLLYVYYKPYFELANQPYFFCKRNLTTIRTTLKFYADNNNGDFPHLDDFNGCSVGRLFIKSTTISLS